MFAAHRRAIVLFAVAAAWSLGGAAAAQAQRGFFASIAYSQSTGKVGYSAGRARTKEAADALAIRMCAADDAKVWMWGSDQWVAIAVVDDHLGSAGFGRGATAAEAQRRALEECAKRAKGHGYRVALCVHSGGRRTSERDLRRVAGKPIESKTGYFAAIAFSPSTGKIGSTAGEAKTIDEAKELALKDCGAEDAKAFMWGDQWIAVAVAPGLKGVAGFGPGASREAAEKAALQQCATYAKGAPCKVALVLFSADKKEKEKEEAAVVQAAAEEPTAPQEPVEP